MENIFEIKYFMETEMGLQVEEKAIFKNGKKKVAFTIGDGELRPTIYPEDLIGTDGDGLREFIDEVLNSASENCSFAESLNKLLKDSRCIKEHVYIGLRPASEAPEYRRVSSLGDDIEEYLYVVLGETPDGNNAFTSLSKGMVSIPEEELWESAEANTCEATVYKDLNLMMAEMGLPFQEPAWDDPCKILMLSNKTRFRGAAALVNQAVLTEIASKLGTDRLMVLPSSIHEVLVRRYDERLLSLEEATSAVKDINKTQLSPCDVLAERAIIIDLTA